MYLFENMVDMALPEGLEWPSEHHRQVAIRLLISNPEVSTLTALQHGAMSILRMPQTQIEKIKLDELTQFGYGYSLIIGG